MSVACEKHVDKGLEETKNNKMTMNDNSSIFSDDESIVVVIDSDSEHKWEIIDDQPTSNNVIKYDEDEDIYEEERRQFLVTPSSSFTSSSSYVRLNIPPPPALSSKPSVALSHSSSAATIITAAYRQSYGSMVAKTPRSTNKKMKEGEVLDNGVVCPSLPLVGGEDHSYDCFGDENSIDDTIKSALSPKNTDSSLHSTTATTALAKKSAVRTMLSATKAKTLAMWKKIGDMIRTASFHIRNSDAGDEDDKSNHSHNESGWKEMDLPYEFTVSECLATMTFYLLFGVVAYSFLFERWSVVDALYFTVVTFTTVGYGDLTPRTVYGRVFTSLFALAGIAILGVVLGVLGSRLVEAQVMAFEKAEKEMSRHVASLFKARKRRKRRKKQRRRRLRQLLFGSAKEDLKDEEEEECKIINEEQNKAPTEKEKIDFDSMTSNIFHFEKIVNTAPLFEADTSSHGTDWSDDMTTETTSSYGSIDSYGTDEDYDDGIDSIITDAGDDYLNDDYNNDSSNTGIKDIGLSASSTSHHPYNSNGETSLLQEPRAKQKKQHKDSHLNRNDHDPSLWWWGTMSIRWIRYYAPAIISLFLGALIIGWNEGWTWIDTLYYCIVTTTTIGYGEWVPRRNETKWFGVLFIPLAVGAMGHLLGTVANFIIEQRRRAYQRQLWTKQQNLTLHDLREMDTTHNGEVTLLEYVEFMLKTMKKVDQSTLDELHSQFSELDLTKSGTICKKDLELMAKKRMRRVKNKLMLSAYKYKITQRERPLKREKRRNNS